MGWRKKSTHSCSSPPESFFLTRLALAAGGLRRAKQKKKKAPSEQSDGAPQQPRPARGCLQTCQCHVSPLRIYSPSSIDSAASHARRRPQAAALPRRPAVTRSSLRRHRALRRRRASACTGSGLSIRILLTRGRLRTRHFDRINLEIEGLRTADNEALQATQAS